SADGQTLLSSSDDQTALVWDVATVLQMAGPPRRPPPPRSLEQLWSDLGSDDSRRADAALRELAARPKEALPLLKERLRPAPAVDAQRVAQLIAELESDAYDGRERAATALAKIGEPARRALQAALKSKPSSELKHRADELLKKLDEHVYPAE